MSKLQDFLMSASDLTEEVREVQISPFPFPFVIRSISERENKDIRKSCQRTSFDKRTHQKTVETDQDLYASRLIITCCTEPNFKDAELQSRYGVLGAEDLLDKVLRPGQYNDLLMAIQELNGFTEDINELVDQAKN